MLTVRAICLLSLAVWLVAGPPAHSQEGAAPASHDPTWLEARADALRVRDELLRELSTMRRLRAAQVALEDWNEARLEVGSTSRTLRPELCEEPDLQSLCVLLPATFGKLEDGS